MKEHFGRNLFAVLLCVAALALLLTFYQSNRSADDAKIYNISVFARSLNDRFMKGIEQAALDYNVDLHFFSSYQERDSEQQIEYLRKELEMNVDAVVINAEDSEAISGFLDTLRSHPPVISLGAELMNGQAVVHVGPDESTLGERLGGCMPGHGVTECLILCIDGLGADQPGRLDKFVETLDLYGIAYKISYCEPTVDGVAGAIAAVDGGGRVFAIAAMDESLIAPMCELAPDDAVLFGIGYTSPARPYLESGRLAELTVYSDYDAGYLCLQTAVTASAGRPVEDARLTVYSANAANMYKEPIVNILFPIG